MSKLQALRALMLDFEALYEKHHPIIEEIFGDVSEEMANPEYAKIHQQIIGIHEEIEGELKKAGSLTIFVDSVGDG